MRKYRSSRPRIPGILIGPVIGIILIILKYLFIIGHIILFIVLIIYGISVAFKALDKKINN